MTDTDPVVRGHVRGVHHALQALVALVFVVGLLLGSVRVVVNAALGLAVTFLPAVLERDHRITLSPGLTLFVTAAVLLHSLGMLGFYEGVPWWDHLTHLLSATIVAGVGYSTAVALDLHSDAVYFPPEFLFVYVLVFTLAFGVAWEVLEFVGRHVAAAIGGRPVLVQYGLADTMLDLVFDVVGAVVFSLWGTGRWTGVVVSVTEWLDRQD